MYHRQSVRSFVAWTLHLLIVRPIVVLLMVLSLPRLAAAIEMATLPKSDRELLADRIAYLEVIRCRVGETELLLKQELATLPEFHQPLVSDALATPASYPGNATA